MDAKKLCSMLITRSLKDLDYDEEEIVVDYLETIGVSVNLDTDAKELCVILLEKTMEKELGRKVPLSAYANSILHKQKEQQNIQKILEKRTEEKKKLEKTQLPGCVHSQMNIIPKTLFNIVVDPSVGVIKLNDGTSQYASLISLSTDLYKSLFSKLSNPILEVTSSKGDKVYTRVENYHNLQKNTVTISPLVAQILDIKGKGNGFIRLCNSLPEILKAEFTFYGTKNELNEILPSLIERLPSVINAFSYLSLGMILVTNINGKEYKVRVDGLIDLDQRPIFAGLIPFSEGDLPFEIEADL